MSGFPAGGVEASLLRVWLSRFDVVSTPWWNPERYGLSQVSPRIWAGTVQYTHRLCSGGRPVVCQ